MKKKKVKAVKDLAIQRALLLYRHAVTAVRQGNIELSKRYISIGKRLLEKTNTRKPLIYRRWVCKRCSAPLVPGLTARIRLRKNRKQIIVTKTCLLCGWVMRTPCQRKQKKSRK